MVLPTRNHHFAVRRLTFFRIALFIPVLLLMTWSGATAQLAGKGQINGTVTDTSGAAIPGAQVVAKSKQTSLATNTTTTSSGDFSLPTLDPGDYTVTITANGFEKIVQENVHVNALETQTLNPKLTVGATSEEVTVSAAPPQLETTNATLGATMEQEMYSALPIEMGAYGQPDQRRATDFAFLMPGVQANNTNGNATTNAGIVNGSGSRGAVTAIYIDGVVFVRGGGNGDPRYVWTAISVDAVNQFQVQTNGYSAMYEGQGVQNYTVKQGGNKYHGSIYEFFRNTALDTWGFFGPATINPATGKATKPVEHSNEYGINLSGPLIPFGSLKDKLFFFGNYNGFRFVNETPTQITFPNAAEQAGNFQGILGSNIGSELASANGIGIYDGTAASQAACTANSTTGPCRYRYGYVNNGTHGPAGNPILGPGGLAAVDVIPPERALADCAEYAEEHSSAEQSKRNQQLHLAQPQWTNELVNHRTHRLDHYLQGHAHPDGGHRASGKLLPCRPDNLRPQHRSDPIQLRPGLCTKDRSCHRRRDAYLLAARHQSDQVWFRALQRPHVQR